MGEETGECSQCRSDCQLTTYSTTVTSSEFRFSVSRPLSTIFFFSVCDSRNLNLSPFCNLTSYSQMAKWQPTINSTYGTARTDYTKKLQGPLRLKYPGQGKAGADRELLTSLKQVLIPNPSQIDQEAEFNMIDFTGEPILQRLRKGYCCGEHILWRSNCVW